MRLLPIECVKEGSPLGKTLYDNDGRVLLKQGAILTSSILKKIKSFKIFSIYIVDEYSDHEIEDIVKPELRQKSISLIKETFTYIERLSSVDISTSTARLNALNKFENYFNSISGIAEDILEDILNNKDALVSLVDIKSMDNYTYQHSVNVAILSVILGISLKLSKSQLQELCLGALLHDMGKVLIPKELIIKPAKLSPEEFETIKLHPKRGYEYLGNQYDLKTTCKLIALQHHERVDGKGYPNGLIHTDIHQYSKIVSIADVYDALTSDRPYRRALCASDALEYIMANCGTLFDYSLVTAFANAIVPFPCGTIVQLSNNDVGIVEKTLPGFPLRPVLKILKSTNTDLINKEFSLVEHLSIVITKVIYNIDDN
ncbi:MAG: HD-GYP domain-containing protein [Clostridium sp.]